MFNAAARRAIEGVADDINVPADALLAVAEVESGGKPFAIVNGEEVPLIRWEGHYFDRLVPADKRAAARKAGLANPKAGAVKNPASQARRYAMLEQARQIDEVAAISSCSWALGQVMGSHWKWLGYASAEAFEKEARSGIAGQVRVMAKFIVRSGLDDELRRHDWSAFARGYNGPAYAKHGYHTQIARAYERYAGAEAPASPVSGMLRLGSSGARVRELQQLLVRAGYAVEVDGDFGSATKRAVETFQKSIGFRGKDVDGVAGPKTLAALQRFKAAPDEEPGKQGPLETEEAKQAAGALGGALGVETASQAIEQAAEKTSWVPGMESLSAILTVAAVLLVLGGLAWAGYGWWKSRKTYEGTS